MLQRRNSKASPLRPLQYMGLSTACARVGLIRSRGDLGGGGEVLRRRREARRGA